MVDILTAIGYVVLNPLRGYSPVGSGEPLVYSSKVISPVDSKSGLLTVSSDAQFIQYLCTVKDIDCFRSKRDGKLVPVMLPDASVYGKISSGTLVAVSHSFEDGTKGKIFVVWGFAVPPGQVVYSFDKFKAVDRARSPLVKDRDGTWQLFIVKTMGANNEVKKPTGDR